MAFQIIRITPTVFKPKISFVGNGTFHRYAHATDEPRYRLKKQFDQLKLADADYHFLLCAKASNTVPLKALDAPRAHLKARKPGYAAVNESGLFREAA